MASPKQAAIMEALAQVNDPELGRSLVELGMVRAVDSFSLDVADGELVCLLGPSGSGKSTLLRMVGGFETPTAGIILVDSIHIRMSLVRRVGEKAIDHAAGMAISSAIDSVSANDVMAPLVLETSRPALIVAPRVGCGAIIAQRRGRVRGGVIVASPG